MLPLFTFLIFGLLWGVAESQFDPCQNYTSIDNPYRSTKYKYKVNSGDVAICDSKLEKGWYRFTSDVGGMIPLTKPPPYSCGTVAPIWIRGQNPNITNETKSVDACTNIFDEDDGCTQSHAIEVKKCEGYFVYHLISTFGCSMAYCAGILIS